MKHNYECKQLNTNPIEISYEKVYNGNIEEQTEILRRFQSNLETRRKFNSPGDP